MHLSIVYLSALTTLVTNGVAVSRDKDGCSAMRVVLHWEKNARIFHQAECFCTRAAENGDLYQEYWTYLDT